MANNQLPIQQLAMGIARSIEAGLKDSTSVEIGFVILITEVGVGKTIGIAGNVGPENIARVLKSALRGIYSDN